MRSTFAPCTTLFLVSPVWTSSSVNEGLPWPVDYMGSWRPPVGELHEATERPRRFQLEVSICDLSGPLWPIMAPRLGTGLAWSHLAIQKSIETKQRNFNVSQMPIYRLSRSLGCLRSLIRFGVLCSARRPLVRKMREVCVATDRRCRSLSGH